MTGIPNSLSLLSLDYCLRCQINAGKVERGMIFCSLILELEINDTNEEIFKDPYYVSESRFYVKIHVMQ